MSQKIAKKDRVRIDRANRQLEIQKRRVTKLEDFLSENSDPVTCPISHHFTDNEQPELNSYCREMIFPAHHVLTGTIYKIECFMFLVKGSMRIVEGDHVRDIYAPCMIKNSVGTKNSWYSYEDCHLFGVTPNPTNSRDLHEVINTYSAIPAEEIQGMGANKQELNYKTRLVEPTNVQNEISVI